jgi:hypothetical protein
MLFPRVGGIFSNEKGSIVLIITVLILVLVVLVIPITYQSLQDYFQLTRSIIHAKTEAKDFARAGIIDAIDYLRRQQPQPVLVFAPQLNLSATPPVNDTDDPTIGLVRTFPINTGLNLWGRYEIHASNLVGDPLAAQDVSLERCNGQCPKGTIWDVQSTGTVFRLRTSITTYNIPPNQIVGTYRVASEIRKLIWNPTLGSAAAVLINQGDQLTVNNNAIIQGGNAFGVTYNNGNPPTVNAGGAILNNALASNAWQQSGAQSGSGPPYALSPVQLFGLDSISDLPSLADIQMNSFPAGTVVPWNGVQLVYINAANVTFGNANPLVGAGVLVVSGNLTITGSTAAHFFSGIIVVGGNATITGSFFMNGMSVVQGKMTVGTATGTQKVQLNYDQPEITYVAQQVCQYREDKLPNTVFGLGN